MHVEGYIGVHSVGNKPVVFAIDETSAAESGTSAGSGEQLKNEVKKELRVRFSEFNSNETASLEFAVIMAKMADKWVFVRHGSRSSYEIPGGKREPNEDILETATRELFEETGALEYSLEPIAIYQVQQPDKMTTAGLLCLAEIKTLGDLPESEIAEVVQLADCPEHLTHPQIQPHLFRYTLDFLENQMAKNGVTL